MSGECNRCGEHALDCNCSRRDRERKPTSKFYAHGRYFDNENEFFKFSAEWENLEFDLEEFEHQMDLRIKEIQMTYELRGRNLTNKQAYQILRFSTDWVVDYII